jgi:hypothetical protein
MTSESKLINKGSGTSNTVASVLKAVCTKQKGEIRRCNIQVDVLKVEQRRKQDP